MRSLVPQLSVGLVCLLLGIGLVTQFRTYRTVAKTEMSPPEEAQVISALVDGNADLRRQVTDLQDQLVKYSQPDSAAAVQAMEQDRDQLRIANGAVPTTGPGVDVLVSGYIRSDELNDLVNELRNAGAEAIGVNGQRISVRSTFTSTAEGYYLDGQPVSPPFRLSAIGLPATLQTALLRQGGVVSLLRDYYPSLTFDVLQRTKIELPALPQNQAIATGAGEAS